MNNVDSKAEDEGVWGMLGETEAYGRHGDTKHDYKTITYTDSKTDYKAYMHASHGMIYARNGVVLWDLYATKAAILMQMRFDGLLGFPGGLVDPDEDPLFGLNRELHEELGIDLERVGFKDEHHIVTFLHEKKKLVLHFFVQEVTMDQFKEIEGHCTKAPEYGIESLGCFRPPLYTMGDNFRGFPAFLCNQFAGNAKEELLYGLLHTKLFTREEIKKAVELSENFKSGLKTNTSGQKELGADSTESDTVKENWGMLLKYESYGRHGDTKNNFKIISRQEAITTYAPFEHVAHGMFFARDEMKIWKEQPVRASVLMQMRFDGRLGFPGGHVDHGENIVAGLNREVHEELGLDISNASEDIFAEEDYAVIYVHEEKKFVLHFFVKEITNKAFQGMLRNSLQAREYGKETAGYLRPPLYMRSGTMEGFPAFLSHQFAGNAKEELFVGLLRADIYSREEIEQIIHLCDGS